MKRFLKNRVLPFVCVFSILVSLCVVPVQANESDQDSIAVASVGGRSVLDILITPVADFYSDIMRVFNGELSDEWGDNWATIPRVANATNPHFYTEDVLYSIVHDWNRNYMNTATYKGLRVDVAPFADTGYYCIRLFEAYGSDSLGPMLCLTEADHGPILYDPASDDGPKDPEAPGADSYGLWIPENDFHSPYHLMHFEDLYNLAHSLGADIAWNDVYYYIFRDDGLLVYADSNAWPYAAIKDKSGHASQNDRPAVDDPDDEIDDEFDAKIDLENGIINLPDGMLAYLDAVIYDESNKTYYVDSHDVENNYYYFHYEYHINYTSITYIGQTEEYNKYYEVYYELPDGRDSADLTKEDLEQLNLSVDVIPYGRSADDTSLRSLYHFDGDTRDSSYWNYCTAFTWNKGASLTYMDAAVFDGALYLDETEHDFTFTLPSVITSGGFTLQFRYYQSHTAAPQTDSYIDFGGTTVMQFDGGAFKNADGTALASTPVGTWNEVALIFDNGIMYYYLNGVCIGSQVGLVPSGNTIKFHFGSAQQTYKYFDELRVLNYALKTGGAYYEPTSIPHDTNLSLVLPGSAVPVADEYWSFSSSGANLLITDFTTGEIPDSVSTGPWNTLANPMPDFPYWVYESDYTVLSAFTNRLRILNSGADKGYSGSGNNIDWIGGLFINMGRTVKDIIPDGDYVFSIVLGDGTVLSCPFTWPIGSSANVNYVRKQYDWGEFGISNIQHSSSYKYSYLYIMPKLGSYVDIAYAELIAGTSTDLKAEWVTTVTEMTEEQFKTPTLAVRTDLDITSYQIGGVRPSIPEKGQVWAMVENERITSIQIYNGQAWEGVDGRIWTGSRWIPASSYNIITLQDMYDIVDATPNYEYIYSESGFWAWWQKSWNAFTERLFAALGNGQGVAGGLPPADQLPAVPDDETTAENEGWSVLELLVVLRDGTWKVITGTVSTAFDGFAGFVSSVSNAGGFFEAYDSKNPDGIFGTTYGEGDLWTQ